MAFAKTLVYLFLCNTILIPVCWAENILVNKVVGAKEELVLSILKLSVEKVNPEITVVQRSEEVPIGRLVEETDEGNVDLMWAGSSADLDKKLLAVRIPLLKGLLGHRIFIIREGEQNRFDDISSINELSSLKAGMGAMWGSTKVLKQAGLPVVTSVKYGGLFYMLDGDRFDYFPRAVHEPWSEVAERPTLNLDVEERLLLVYPYAMYFYVKKDNLAIHRLLSEGLEIAIADGSFNELFYNNPMVKSAVKNANLSQRVVMRINNSAMHPDTPIDRSELWLDVENL